MTLTAYLPPTLLSGLSDVSVSPGSAQNGYPLTWDNTLGKWVAPSPGSPLQFHAATAMGPSFRINPGVSPTSPNNGDMWFEEGKLKIRVGTVTRLIAYVAEIVDSEINLNFNLESSASTLTTRYF